MPILLMWRNTFEKKRKIKWKSCVKISIRGIQICGVKQNPSLLSPDRESAVMALSSRRPWPGWALSQELSFTLIYLFSPFTGKLGDVLVIFYFSYDGNYCQLVWIYRRNCISNWIWSSHFSGSIWTIIYSVSSILKEGEVTAPLAAGCSWKKREW